MFSVSWGRRIAVLHPHNLAYEQYNFTPGADVFTTRGHGVIVDVQATPSGKFVFEVEYIDGEVDYFTEKALRLARS